MIQMAKVALTESRELLDDIGRIIFPIYPCLNSFIIIIIILSDTHMRN